MSMLNGGDRGRRLALLGSAAGAALAITVLSSFIAPGDCDALEFNQVNVGGFGNPNNHYSWSTKVYHNGVSEQLYIGTYNPTDGGEIWRYDGTAWENLVVAGGSTTENEGFRIMEVFLGRIWAGASNFATGAQLLCSPNGNPGTFAPVVTGGFGNPDHTSIRLLQTFNGALYVGLQDTEGSTEGGLYRTFDGTNFETVDTNGFGNTQNNSYHTAAVFNDQLYIGTRNALQGLEIHRSSTGNPGSFEKVVGSGSGTPAGFGAGGFGANKTTLDLHVHTDGNIYVGLARFGGYEVWRSDTGNGGDWERTVADGGGDRSLAYSWYFASWEGRLYMGNFNFWNFLFGIRGAALQRSTNGVTWETLVGRNGTYFGYGFDETDNWGVRTLEVFQGKLFACTAQNFDAGGAGTEVWEITCAP